jgi:pSer/pThr/pTyr-binding forkhead associated (FHA) protein
MPHRYCPECGFQNPETANFCSKCGALLVREEGGESTMAFTPEQGNEEGHAALEDVGIKGPALVVRSGGGRTGETFPLEQHATTVGRSPECDIFLDDVTVSRRHAIVAYKSGRLEIEDLGSLNGTYLNRRRIESPAQLDDGDELQIGKYRLTFLQ